MNFVNMLSMHIFCQQLVELITVVTAVAQNHFPILYILYLL